MTGSRKGSVAYFDSIYRALPALNDVFLQEIKKPTGITISTCLLRTNAQPDDPPMPRPNPIRNDLDQR